ncbi:TPA: type IIL restriction-modification enzyme MmeI [Streptococcus suis]
MHHGNAQTTDWEIVVDKDKLNYIIGNPPFLGARVMSKDQKEDLLSVFGNYKGAGNLDFVSGWYLKAAELMRGTDIQTALVSTNSITQGEQASLLWKILVQDFDVTINFAYKTFKWNSEAKDKAAVHCVIIGFGKEKAEKVLFETLEQVVKVEHINGYLIEASDIFIENRTKSLSDVPDMGIGNKPIDGGFYLFEKSEMEDFIKNEPKSANYFRKWYGAKEFINQEPRYCLWLGDASPAELRSMPQVMKRIEAVRNYRLESPSAGTRKIAEKPTRFHVENMPESTYIIVPSVSSERRRYIPMGFMTPENLASNLVLIIPNATLYHFGILTSNVHMAWMRTVAGRLEMRYRYSAKIVYNNFPWPEVTEEQKEAIAKTAQAILDARALYPDSSLADLYDELTMPVELRKAHQANDKAVMTAYGMTKVVDGKKTWLTESETVERLFDMHEELVK